MTSLPLECPSFPEICTNDRGSQSLRKIVKTTSSSTRRLPHKTYSIKIPPGLRALLNGLTKEVLCSSQAIEHEQDLYAFCADFLESLLGQRDKNKLSLAMVPDQGRRHSKALALKREGTFHLMATDSGTAIPTSDFEEDTLSGPEDGNPLHCLELEFTLDRVSKANNVRGGDSSITRGPNKLEHTLLARVDLLVSRKRVKIRPRGDNDHATLTDQEADCAGRSRIPIKLIPHGHSEEDQATPIHSINSVTSDLPPSPTSLQSWTSSLRPGGEIKSGPEPGGPKDTQTGRRKLRHSLEDEGPQTGTIRVWLPSESLAFTGQPSPGTKEGAQAKRECEDLLGASQSGHRSIIAKGEEEEEEAEEAERSSHARAFDQGQAGTGEEDNPSQLFPVCPHGPRRSHTNTYPSAEVEDGPERSSCSRAEGPEEDTEGKVENASEPVLSQLSADGGTPPHDLDGEATVSTRTQDEETTTLSEVGTQTIAHSLQPDADHHHLGGQWAERAQDQDSLDDYITARVLLEHVGTVFSPLDPRRVVNYLDLSKLGEEGETPASDEIWLAIEGEEEKGFLTSTEEDPDSLSVDTDKLSTIATMAGRLSVDSIAPGTPSEPDSMGMGNNNNHREEMKPDSGQNFGELYSSLTNRLQGILNEELVPIQNTLDATGRNVNSLADKFQQMESLLATLCETMQKVRSDLEENKGIEEKSSHKRAFSDMRNASEKSLDQIVSKIESLSVEIGQADTANQLREDNNQLRKDLNLYRNREHHLIERIETMEKMMHKVPNGFQEPSPRSQSRRGSQDSESELPPIDPKPLRQKRSQIRDHPDELTKGSLILTGHRSVKKLLVRRGSQERTKPLVPTLDLEAIQTDIQVARSDNVILRQDLQVCRDRECQLVRRNKELEDKILSQAQAANAQPLHKCTADVTVPPQPALASTNGALPRAEIDINIDFTPPGRAIIQQRQAQVPMSQKLKQAKVETLAHLEQEALGHLSQDTGEELTRANVANKSSETGKSRADDKKAKKLPLGRKAIPKTEPMASGKLGTKKAMFQTDDWKVNINSDHDLETNEDSPNTIIVTQKIVQEEEPSLNEALVQEETTPVDEVKPLKPQIVQKSTAELKSEPKLKSPPKVTAPQTATAQKEEPNPKSMAPEVKREPRVRPMKVVRKAEVNHDPRYDPIPKPGQFPCARPPRDYVPGRVHKRTSVADILNYQGNTIHSTPLSKSNDNLGRESVQSDRGPELVQMFIKEEPSELCDSAAPICQVRESPDGANSSVINGGRFSKCSGSVSVVPLDHYDANHETGTTRASSSHDIIRHFVLQEEQELQDLAAKKRRKDDFWTNKRRPAVIRRPKSKRSRSLSREKFRMKTNRTMCNSIERLPTLSAFDEERIEWIKSYENDSVLEEERRQRALVRHAAAHALQSAMAEISVSSTSSNTSPVNSVLEQDDNSRRDKGGMDRSRVQSCDAPTVETEVTEEKPTVIVLLENSEKGPIKKSLRKQWDTKVSVGGFETEEQRSENAQPVTENEVKETRHDGTEVQNSGPPSTPPLSGECFIVSRGWQMDQSKLLRALDRIKCASFSRVQIASTINRVVENVRPHLDVVVIHIGDQELMDATNCVGDSKESVLNVAGSVATVISRQIIKVAQQNRATQFLISCPLARGTDAGSTSSDELQKFFHLRKAFNTTLKANCSSCSNVQCSENDNLTAQLSDSDQSRESRYFSDSLHLNSAGMRKLARNWENFLRRIARASDGQLVLRQSSSDSSSTSSSSAIKSFVKPDSRVPWKPY